jgi:uncharacterized membrane-anchored protein
MLLVITAQLAVPFRMIQSRETVLEKGELFRFKTRPIDPADPFQGRYVRLGIQNDYIPRDKKDQSKFKYNTPVYASVETDNDGFAHFTEMTREHPETDSFLKTRYRGSRRRWHEETKKHIYLGDRIDIPFDRFYMDEAKAPRAEQIARQSANTTNCWVNVRIYKGKAVIEDVFAEGQSLKILAEKENN